MTLKKAAYRFLLTAALASCLAACQTDALSRLGVENPTGIFESTALFDTKAAPANQEKMVVNKVEFAPDHKTFSVWTGVVSDIGPYSLTDSTVVRIEVEEFDDGVPTAARVRPRLVKAWNTESDQIKELGVKVLVLVDLSLPQSQIDAQREAVKEMMTAFNRDNLYVAFMSGTSVTPSRPVSDYILGLYFKNWSGQKCLYRSILTKINEMAAREEPWDDARQLKLVVFSDGAVYDQNDEPMDPDHFHMESELLHGEDPGRESVNVYYVNFGKASDSGEDSDAANVLTSLCEASGGAFLPKFNWTLLENTMLGEFSRAINSNRFDFVNPDGKVYRGDNNQLKIKFYSIKENRLLATATADIREGTLYRPLIVNGISLSEVILEGLSAGLFIMLLIYVVCQFILPFARYHLFLRHYVIRHTCRSMVVGDIAVAESCYLCKEPFKEGDEVVVKCEHTMHKSCWDENEYHCPEYGRHCQHGSHYYNRYNLLDRRNASFYLEWLLMAVLAAILAWTMFTVWSNFTSKHILEYLIPVEHLAVDRNGTHLTRLPFSSFSVSFFLTFGIAILAFRRQQWISILGGFLRGLVAGVVSAVLFLLESAACIALHLEAVGFFINIIPWVLSSFVIAFVGTYGTRIKLKKSIILIAVGVSLVSMNVWSSIYMIIGVDFRELLLYSFMIYTVGIALSIASAAPRSEHYFLRVQGAVKTMDVALYKWFRSNPNAVVSLGRSVDCSLQLSWDLQGNVAPLHAEIRLNKGTPRLVALEEGVLLSGKPLEVDKPVPLYHGTQFQIGQTTFTYQEKDL